MPEFSHLKNPETMQRNLSWYGKRLAPKHNMILVPVGDYWLYALKNYPYLNLYNVDGTHPSREGSLFIALIFYKILVDSTVDDVNSWPWFINFNEKESLLALSSKEI